MNRDAELLKQAVSMTAWCEWRGVALKRSGQRFKGCCPFHSEETPSFTVYPDTQSFYCFGCGIGGDVITAEEHFGGGGYAAARDRLAQQFGVILPQQRDLNSRKLDIDRAKQAALTCLAKMRLERNQQADRLAGTAEAEEQYAAAERAGKIIELYATDKANPAEQLHDFQIMAEEIAKDDPAEAERLTETIFPKFTKFRPDDYSDTGEAAAFVEHYGDIIRYSPQTGWMVYNGIKWVIDGKDEPRTHKLLQEFTDKQLKEARNSVQAAAKSALDAREHGNKAATEAAEEAVKDAEGYHKFVIRQRNRTQQTLFEAEPRCFVDVSELDADPFSLNTPEGVIDLRTGAMREHRPGDLCTKCAAFSPSDRGADTWHKFLTEITCDDTDLAEYLKVLCGMTLIGEVFTECLQIANGGGGNGKSTFYDAFASTLADYAGSIDPDILISDSKKNKSFEFATMKGLRLLIAAETAEGKVLDTATLKRLASTDSIKAEYKYKDAFSYRPSHSVVLFTNFLPKVRATDDGTWSRLKVIPFRAEFRNTRQEIVNYAATLSAECGGAIIKWAVDGARQYIAAHYKIKIPAAAKEATEQYRMDSDLILRFITECCETGPKSKVCVSATSLYGRFQDYCKEREEKVFTKEIFKKELLKKKITHEHTNTGNIYRGVCIREIEHEN